MFIREIGAAPITFDAWIPDPTTPYGARFADNDGDGYPDGLDPIYRTTKIELSNDGTNFQIPSAAGSNDFISVTVPQEIDFIYSIFYNNDTETITIESAQYGGDIYNNEGAKVSSFNSGDTINLLSGFYIIYTAKDRDRDGYIDEEDEFPDDSTEHKDSDQDGVGDNSDNAPNTYNPGQEDSDNDGEADVIDDFPNQTTEQTITFPSISDRLATDGPLTLSAVSSSGLPITYISSDNTIATISENVVTFVGTGEVTITALQAGNDQYFKSSSTQTFTIIPVTDSGYTGSGEFGDTGVDPSLILNNIDSGSTNSTSSATSITAEQGGMIVTPTGSMRFFKTGETISLAPGETIFFGDITDSNSDGIPDNLVTDSGDTGSGEFGDTGVDPSLILNNIDSGSTNSTSSATSITAEQGGMIVTPTGSMRFFKTGETISLAPGETIFFGDVTDSNSDGIPDNLVTDSGYTGSGDFGDTGVDPSSLLNNIDSGSTNSTSSTTSITAEQGGMIVTPTGSIRLFKAGETILLEPGETIFFGDLKSINAPTGLSIEVISNSSLKITWEDASNDEDGFKVYRSTTIDSAFIEISDLAADSLEYIDTGLTTNTTYYYRVESYNIGYTSNYVSASGTTSNTLLAPSGLSVTATSNTTIDLTWQDNNVNEDGYKVARSTDGVNYTDISTLGQDVTTYTDTGLTLNTTYYYQVRGYNVSGESNTVSGSTKTTNILVNTPTITSATVVSYEQVDISWTDTNTNETSFELEFSSDGGANYSAVPTNPVLTTAQSSATYSHTGLAQATTYQWRIRAVNTDGESSWSTAVPGTTEARIYDLVVDGDGTETGTGPKAYGSQVNITALAPAGYTFSNWTTSSAGVSLVDANSSSTSFTMPANDVTITANYTATD